MSYSKILVTGASGFIGTRLCEKFKLQYDLPYRALVRNFNRAARIARLDSELVAGDISNSASLAKALEGCDAVVNLAPSPGDTAEREMRALLAACQTAGVKRLIHISSMSVHGPTPGPECAHEATATIGRYSDAYSNSKAIAEKTIQAGLSRVPGVILRPTVVYGPYSPFVIAVVQSARTGVLTLLDDGAGICNAVHVDDVCDAIYAALYSDAALGKAMFINSDHAIKWREFNLTFATMVQPPPAILNYSAQETRAYWNSRKPTLRSNAAALKRLLMSSDFHDQLGLVPAFRAGITWSKETLKKKLPPSRVSALIAMKSQTDPAGAASGAAAGWPNIGRLIREDFHLEFSNELAKKLLDWKPQYDFEQGAAMTKLWLDFTGMLEPWR